MKQYYDATVIYPKFVGQDSGGLTWLGGTSDRRRDFELEMECRNLVPG